MQTRGMQTAVCGGCGMPFRTRAHQTECIETPLNPKILSAASALSEEYIRQWNEEQQKRQNKKQ